MGFSFYKAAMQAPDNGEFIRRMKMAIQTYEKESRILEKKGKTSSHALALTAYASSCLEKDPLKKKELLAEWWNLEKQAKKDCESIDDLHSMAKICTNLVEYSSYDWIWSSSSFQETKNIYLECLEFAEIAIPILSKLEDEYELARAYCFASWHYSFCSWFWESEEEIVPYTQKAADYSKKALILAQRIGDDWLISQSYTIIWSVAQSYMMANPNLAINPGKKILKYGEITKDNWCMGWGNILTASSYTLSAQQMEDPEKQRQSFKKSINMIREANKFFQRIHSVHELHVTSLVQNRAFGFLADIEPDKKRRNALLETLINSIQEKKEFFKNREVINSNFAYQLSYNFNRLAKTEIDIEKKRSLLLQAKSYSQEQIIFSSNMHPFHYHNLSINYSQLAIVLRELAGIQLDKQKKIDILNKAADFIRVGLEKLQKRKEFLLKSAWANGFYFGKNYDLLGKILEEIYFLTKDKKTLTEGIQAYNKTVFHMKKAELPTHVSEAYWHLAQLHDQIGEFKEASNNYESAAQAYDVASNKIPQFKDFYSEHSLYMRAWSQIEQARHNHQKEDYAQAMNHYEKAAELHKSLEPWSYLTSNYSAWAQMEKAEDLSRKENTQQAKQTFQKAYKQFYNAEESLKQKLEEIIAEDEKEMTQKLFEASDLRKEYCQARIHIEEAKLFDREGKYQESSKKYGRAAQNISTITKKIDVEAERKELEYVAILCQAWKKMALGQETASSESYLEAAELFEQAKEQCYTKKASYWALGNSYFCKGLAAQNQFQKTLDRSYHSKANKYIKQAANYYKQAGYQKASEYAKATQRLFDAYLYMNSAEDEVDPEKKTKYYQLAEQLLQIAANAFSKAQQADKTTQVQSILSTVREEKALATSLNVVMQAPTIASTTQSFTAPTPTNEISVGLEQFDHANVQANLITSLKQVKVGQSFCLSIEFVNAGRESALLMRVENFVPPDFIVVKKPDIYRIEETTLNMKGKQLAPLKFVEIKLTLHPSKKGKYQLNPKVHYLDERGKNKSLQLKTLEIKVEEVTLSDRVATGTQELDSLLLGGIPSEYAVVLTGPPSDEREYLIRNFLQSGIKDDELVFYVSTEAEGLEHLLEEPNFYLFLCNLKPKTQVPDLSNVYKLRSKTDLTNLSISLAKAYRNIEPSKKKRICVETVSDVLVDYETKATRKWISELITDLGAKGFTMLAVINPDIHPHNQARAIIDLFDGEINLTETEDPLECKKSIRVRKLRNKDYIKNPICLT
jgi:KaiC/GvpD/RAD55 family RecA-like ATPase